MAGLALRLGLGVSAPQKGGGAPAGFSLVTHNGQVVTNGAPVYAKAS